MNSYIFILLTEGVYDLTASFQEDTTSTQTNDPSKEIVPRRADIHVRTAATQESFKHSLKEF